MRFSPRLEFRMYSVNILAELVEVDAAHIDMPISHQGIDCPDRKKSFALDDARFEHNKAIPNIKIKKRAMVSQSIQLSNINLSYCYPFENLLTIPAFIASPVAPGYRLRPIRRKSGIVQHYTISIECRSETRFEQIQQVSVKRA